MEDAPKRWDAILFTYQRGGLHRSHLCSLAYPAGAWQRGEANWISLVSALPPGCNKRDLTLKLRGPLAQAHILLRSIVLLTPNFFPRHENRISERHQSPFERYKASGKVSSPAPCRRTALHVASEFSALSPYGKSQEGELVV